MGLWCSTLHGLEVKTLSELQNVSVLADISYFNVFFYILQLCSLIAKVSIHDLHRDVVEALDRVSVDRLLSLHFSLEVPPYLTKHPIGAYRDKRRNLAFSIFFMQWTAFSHHYPFPSASVEALWCWILLGGQTQVSPSSLFWFVCSKRATYVLTQWHSNFLLAKSKQKMTWSRILNQYPPIQNILPLLQTFEYFLFLVGSTETCLPAEKSCHRPPSPIPHKSEPTMQSVIVNKKCALVIRVSDLLISLKSQHKGRHPNEKKRF